jgi:hypothetical protein
VPPCRCSNGVLQRLYKETGSAKIEAVREYVHGLCQAGEKFLVFAYHLDVIRAIESELAKLKVGRS